MLTPSSNRFLFFQSFFFPVDYSKQLYIRIVGTFYFTLMMDSQIPYEWRVDVHAKLLVLLYPVKVSASTLSSEIAANYVDLVKPDAAQILPVMLWQYDDGE